MINSFGRAMGQGVRRLGNAGADADERVNRAREFLETTDESISHIAERCGFGTAQSLRTHFTRINQISPSRYRQTFRPEAAA